MDLEKIGLSAGAGALYAAGAVAATAVGLTAYLLGSKVNTLINTYTPAFKGTLNAGLVIGASSLVAFPVSTFLDKREYETLAKIAGILTIFTATAMLAPKVTSQLSIYRMSQIEAALYGLAGTAAFLNTYTKPEEDCYGEEY